MKPVCCHFCNGEMTRYVAVTRSRCDDCRLTFVFSCRGCKARQRTRHEQRRLPCTEQQYLSVG